MRKPDGVAIAGALGKLSSDNSSGVIRHPTGVRRKSMLPNSLARLSESRSDGESDTGDVDDIDTCLALGALNRPKSPDSSSSGSTLTEPPSELFSSRSSRDDIERVPTPVPPLHAEPYPAEALNDVGSSPVITHDSNRQETVVTHLAPPTRTSPRKAQSGNNTELTRNKARRSSALPTKTPARAIPASAGRSRSALADLPEPNPRMKPAPTIEAGATAKPRSGVSSRR
jgi:hypothetical protein